MMTHRKRSHPSIVQACTKFQDNCCKFQEEYCWFSHQSILEEDDSEEGLDEKDTEEIVDKVNSVFQKVLKNPKPPLKTANQNQQ